MPKPPLEMLEYAPLTGLQRKIITPMAINFGKWHATNDLIDIAYTFNGNKGIIPDQARSVISVSLSTARHALERIGLAIESQTRAGRRIQGKRVRGFRRIIEI